jgi:molecular chaperone DnaK
VSADRTILGIDLGVTGVAMAAFDEDGRTRVIPNADGEDVTPACLHVFDADGVVVGAEARKMLALEPENVVDDVPWHLGEADWRPSIQGRTWAAQELVGLLLRKLRDDASDLRGVELRRAVLAVPAWYDSARRHAAVEAAGLAGLEVLSLVNQPLCAALGVGAQRLEADGPLLVFDLGGRDLEVTVLHKERDTLTVKTSQVRYDLCLHAFELRIRQHLVERFRQETRAEKVVEDEILAQQVVDAARSALATLAHRDAATVRLAQGGVQARITLDRATFGIKTAPLLVAAIGLADQLLREAGHRPDEAIACVAVGRGSRLPNVQRALRERFGDRLLLPPDPDQRIARGAALLAVLRHDRHHPGLSARPPERSDTEDFLSGTGSVDRGTFDTPEPVVTRSLDHADPAGESGGFRAVIGLADGGHDEVDARDATTNDLGLIALDKDRRERVIRLIPRSTPLPCEVRGKFTYAYPGMTGVRVEVTEGRGERREDVAVVGTVELTGLPPRPVGTPIEIVYRYDVDQILQVQVVDLDTGIRRDARLTWRGGLSSTEARNAARRSDTIRLE